MSGSQLSSRPSLGPNPDRRGPSRRGSRGSRHEGEPRAWSADDAGPQAAWLYGRLAPPAEALFDLLIDAPGVRFGGEDIAKQLGLEKGGARLGLLAWPGRYSRHLGRVLPIDTEGGGDGGTDYYMEPDTAALFSAARAEAKGSRRGGTRTRGRTRGETRDRRERSRERRRTSQSAAHRVRRRLLFMFPHRRLASRLRTPGRRNPIRGCHSRHRRVRRSGRIERCREEHAAAGAGGHPPSHRGRGIGRRRRRVYAAGVSVADEKRKVRELLLSLAPMAVRDAGEPVLSARARARGRGHRGRERAGDGDRRLVGARRLRARGQWDASCRRIVRASFDELPIACSDAVGGERKRLVLDVCSPRTPTSCSSTSRTNSSTCRRSWRSSSRFEVEQDSGDDLARSARS